MDNFAKEIENLIISNIPKQLSASVIMNNEGQRIDQSINSVNQCLLQILSKLQNIERDLFIIKRIRQNMKTSLTSRDKYNMDKF